MLRRKSQNYSRGSPTKAGTTTQTDRAVHKCPVEEFGYVAQSESSDDLLPLFSFGD